MIYYCKCVFHCFSVSRSYPTTIRNLNILLFFQRVVFGITFMLKNFLITYKSNIKISNIKISNIEISNNKVYNIKTSNIKITSSFHSYDELENNTAYMIIKSKLILYHTLEDYIKEDKNNEMIQYWCLFCRSKSKCNQTLYRTSMVGRFSNIV